MFLKTLFLTCLLPIVAAAQDQKFASLGDFKLESGEVIRDCQIGYRTFGKLNEDKSNAILFTTWASGTTEQLASNFGPGKVVDSTKYYIVALDALGNGVSSSPSNSRLQPRMKFPKFTIRDMVNSQHEVLLTVFHLDHVKAVMGISMGGMQTFQWVFSFPNFMDKAVPIVGSPRLAPYDLMQWQAQLDAIFENRDWNNGNYANNPARAADAAFAALLLSTPENYNKRRTRKQVFEELEKAKSTKGFDSNDKIRTIQAMMPLDVSEPFGGSLEQAATTVKAKMFVIVSKTDHVVTPGPALEFAAFLHTKVLELENDCGHGGMNCEEPRVNSAIAEFLDQ